MILPAVIDLQYGSNQTLVYSSVEQSTLRMWTLNIFFNVTKIQVYWSQDDTDHKTTKDSSVR